MADEWAEFSFDEEPVAAGNDDDWGEFDFAEDAPAPVEEKEPEWSPAIQAELDKAENLKPAWEVGRTIVQGLAGEIAGGLAGLAKLYMSEGDVKAAADTVEAVRESLQYAPEDEGAQQALASMGEFLAPIAGGIEGAAEQLGRIGGILGEPVGMEAEAATIGHVIPYAAAELFGLKGAGKIAKSQHRDLAEAIDETAPDIPAEAIPEDLSIEELATGIAKGKRQQLAEVFRTDAEVLDAAEKLGVDLTPGHYTTNANYKRVERALAKRPGSKLKEQDIALEKELAASADDLIRKSGGDADISILDAEINAQYTKTISDLEKRAEDLYDNIVDWDGKGDLALINPKARVVPKASIRLIEKELELMGGDIGALSSTMRDVYKRLYKVNRRGQTITPTYAALDSLRREIGSGFKRAGAFKDATDYDLKRIYGALSNDQLRIAHAFGRGDDLSLAQSLVSKRKELEGNMEALYGRDLSKGIVSRLSTSMAALTKGEVANFRKIIDSVPAEMRRRVAATALNNLFGLNAKGSTGIGSAFGKTYRQLERNRGAMNELKRHIPKDQWERFQAIGTLSKSIDDLRSIDAPSAVEVAAMLDRGGILSKVVGLSGNALVIAGWKMGGHWLAAAASKAGQSLKRMVDAEKAANELLVSPAFAKALTRAAEGNPELANLGLKKSRKFQTWLRYNTEAAAQIGTVGAIQYFLTGPEQPPQIGEQN